MIEWKREFHVRREDKGQKVVKRAPSPVGDGVPRVARLMALAIHFEGLVSRGEVADYAELARLGHVTRARLTQIMNLLSLAPDLQEEVLFLTGRSVTERGLRRIAGEVEWGKQREAWIEIGR